MKKQITSIAFALLAPMLVLLVIAIIDFYKQNYNPEQLKIKLLIVACIGLISLCISSIARNLD